MLNVRVRDIPRTVVTNPLCPRPYQRRAVGLFPRAGLPELLGRVTTIPPYKGV